jgi:hypothetical protein
MEDKWKRKFLSYAYFKNILKEIEKKSCMRKVKFIE